MAQAPNVLQPDTEYSETIALINDNNQKTVSDMGDLGAKFSGTGSISATVLSTNMFSIPFTILDDRPQYVPGKTQIMPRVDVFVDTNNDATFLLPNGNSLSAGQTDALVSAWVARTPQAGFVAGFTVQLKNFDVADHTYYFVADDSYVQSPPTGNLR